MNKRYIKRGFTGLKVFVFTALFLVSGMAGQDDITLPQTPAGTKLQAFLDVFNTGDADNYQSFIENNHVKSDDPRRSTEARVGIYQMLFNDLGQLEIHQILNAEDNSISVLMKSLKPTAQYEWVEFTLMLNEENHDLINSFQVLPGMPPLDLPGRPLSDDEITEMVRAFVDEKVSKDEFSGTILFARGDDIIYQDVRGKASLRFNIPMQFDTKLNLGSMNKMITAVAIGQLVDQGKLSFDDKLGDILPDFPMKDAAEKVTVHHLLTHTSGLGDYWTDEWERNWFWVRTLDDYLPYVVVDSLQFEPGDQFSYSNSGFIVLGMIIEKVSGQSYFDYVRENIYKPAGMENTYCYHMEDPIPNLAIGYTKTNFNGEPIPGWKNNFYRHAPQGGPAGGGFSTAPDLLKFIRALTDNKVISEQTRDILWEGKVPMGGPGMKYGYGFGDHHDLPYRYIGHTGGAPGINAFLGYIPQLDITVIVLSNYDDGAMQIADHFMRLVTHK